MAPPSLAATDDETAVVLVEQTPEGPSQIVFNLFSSRLETIATRRFADPAFSTIPPASSLTVQVAALPSGWVVLSRINSTLTLITLDRLGNVVATKPLELMLGGSSLSLAYLVSRPGGGPMVAWGSIENYAAVVSADGLQVTAPVRLPYNFENVGPTLPSLAGAAYAAGKFQAILSVNCKLGTGCIEIVSVASDGTIAGTFLAPGVTASWGALLESDTDDLRLHYVAACGADFTDPCLMWARMTPSGTALAAPVVIQHAESNVSPIAAVADGVDNYLSFLTTSGSSTLVRTGPDGKFIGDPKPFATGGSAGATIVRQGSGLVAAWVSLGRIEVALLAP